MGGGHSRSGCFERAVRGATVLLALPLASELTRPACAYAAPLEVYGRLPQLEQLALSPDGSRLAFVRTEGEARTVVMMPVGKQEVLGALRAGDQKLRGIEWADNDHLLIMTSVTGMPSGWVVNPSELFQLQSFDVRSRRSFMVPHTDSFNDARVANFIGGPVTVRRVGDRTVLLLRGLQYTVHSMGNAMMESRLMRVLMRVDLASNNARIVRQDTAGTDLAWILDGDGEVAAEEDYDQRTGHWSISVRRDGRMQPATSGEGKIEVPRLLGWGPTADTLLLEQIEDGDSVWRLMSLKDGSIGPPLAEKKILDRPIEDRRTHRMIGGVHVTDSAEYVFFNPDQQQSWQTVLHTFPNERVHLQSAAEDFRRVIVRVEGESDGYSYQLVDLTARTAVPLGDVYEGVKQPLAVRRITYGAADGLQIPAYLTLPRGKSPQKLPLIVLPHGGPAVRDTADFDWWSQALADQGYAVLQPNYRGSAINRAFTAKGFGEWGRRMQTDLSDGVRYLVKEGVVDPTRVCIVGASYGGYAALAGPSLDPGVYRCAVAVAGISDIRSMLKWVNDRQYRQPNVTQRYWDRFMGVSGPDDSAAATISPLSHVDAITVPVLLIHGKDDTVVPFEQSQMMYEALRRQNKEAQLVTLKNEDHWLSRSATRLQMLQESVAFLRKYNPPD